MAKEQLLSGKTLEKKLKNVGDAMFKADTVERQYVDYLAERVSRAGPLTEQGLKMHALYCLDDLKNGVDGVSKKEIHHTLVGHQDMVYSILMCYTEDIVKRVYHK